MMTLVKRENIEKYIPQRAPFVMIHTLLEADEQHAVTSFQVEHNNLFCKNGFFTEPGLIENIAQTAAAHAGYRCISQGLPVPLGFIAAIRKLSIYELPPVNGIVHTTVKIVNQVMDVTIVQGTIEWNSQIACECEMRIFIKKN